MTDFSYSFKGLISIIKERKLFFKKPYLYTLITVIISNLILYFIKSHLVKLDYFEILKIYVNIFLSPFVTFCGFTMTAYSLVVGFLNYGVFKSTIEQWYLLKINIDKGLIKKDIQKYSLYQNGIALFALAILLLLLNVVILLITRFLTDLHIEIAWNCIEVLNAFILFIITLISSYCIVLIFYNIVNIFTFSQSLNELVYHEVLKKFDQKK
ncbi:hypothetical protein BAY06_07200 [Elizabethkingia anophelis]|uniref:hypothetical protein n=1 Tax=Elizabethkingia anophelis TaxID=1117645 RepID=UPI00099AB795|nr:hypothetical protein [Elizabethkingia anophelis]MCT4320904.1 hypothetical protein [Elizabethkingia anophelis]OPC50952.1 hypothetical protein BAY06_07200 [Elizabethkingia anophelis]HAY3534874.1 hypothetical protein [Elizabethkingia anophelis]HAY3546990.1 hypothetical protein [Elizabethkingia anophelis]HAY3591321.1 hypothetical protein [Elizabethkingia anophelis]